MTERLIPDSRTAYEQVQIGASSRKLHYCKFSFEDASKYVSIVRTDRIRRAESPRIGRVLCLGVRNGREVDCFRIASTGGGLRQRVAALAEHKRHGLNSHLPWAEAIGRSNWSTLDPDSCIGVELNPLVKRPDVWNGSFDRLPGEWSGQFDVVYTNAFDHAYDPEETTACWRRVIKPGGYFILGFPEGQTPSTVGPVGEVSLKDVMRYFPGELVYYQSKGSKWWYTEYIVRLA